MTRLTLKHGTWDEIKTAVIEDDHERVDFDLRWGDLTAIPNMMDGTLPATMLFDNGIVGRSGASMPDGRMMTDRAYAQYLGKLGIPHGFATKFSGDLQSRMIEERLPDVDPKSKVFLRARPGQVRAVLSGRYGDMRDREVAEILDGLLPDLSGYEVLRGRVDDHLFTVTLLGVEPIFENGDKYYPIHVLGNSEVGARAFHITSGICKGVCSNGMIFGLRRDANYRIRHLGSKMRESVVVAMQTSLGNVGQWREQVGPAIERAHEIEIDLGSNTQRDKMVQNLRNRGLTKRFANDVLSLAQNMPEETYGDEFAVGEKITKWHVVNAMTHLAQADGVSEDRRYEIEAAAGALLLARAA